MRFQQLENLGGCQSKQIWRCQCRDIFRAVPAKKHPVIANRAIENYIQIFTWRIKLRFSLQNKHFVLQIDSYIKAYLLLKMNSNVTADKA